MLGGVQKAGTSALAAYLARVPSVQLPEAKEAHVFDAPDFDEQASAEAIDARLDAHYRGLPAAGVLRGDATPITVFEPAFVARVAHYNPAMKWVLLLREPVARAISQWQMERSRGVETSSLWRSVLAEPRRLREAHGDWRLDSPLRWASYAARSDYAPQLRVVRQHFPDAQILLLSSDALAAYPAKTVDRVLHFLGLPNAEQGDAEFPRVFAGDYVPPPAWSPGRLLLRWRLRDACARWNRARSLDDWTRP
jgi:hypothetical protein